MHTIDLEFILDTILNTRIGVIGDFCLDAYWETDSSRSELSVETGLPTRAVRTQHYSLGDVRTAARKLAAEWGKPVFISRGDRGCLVGDNDQVDSVPGLHIVAQTDPVGAGQG